MSLGTSPTDTSSASSSYEKQVLDGLALIALGIKDLVTELRRRAGTFRVSIGGNDQDLQQWSGVVRTIVNPTAGAITVTLTDDEMPLTGPLTIAAGAAPVVCYLPFQSSLRATVTGGYAIIAGEARG